MDLDWWFRDRRSGRLVIAQPPNPPLWVALAALGSDAVFRPTGTAGTVLTAVGRAALMWWAADEVLRGVNPWRRLLGAGVAGVALVRWLG